MAYTTKKSLLRKVREGDEIGWHEFYETYKPLILRRGRRLANGSVSFAALDLRHQRNPDVVIAPYSVRGSRRGDEG